MKPYVIGNWKMNLSLAESEALARAVAGGAPADKARVVLCPPFTSIANVAGVIRDTDIQLGAQDVSAEENGPHTGDVSAAMLKDLGCQYVIVGHSERRRKFGEDSAFIRQKINMALKYELTPVLCVGENMSQREGGRWRETVSVQLKEALNGAGSVTKGLIVAYEPVWAIGTGNAASAFSAREAAQEIRRTAAAIIKPGSLDKDISVIYGGSITPRNVHTFIGNGMMDGVLVGADSLRAELFNGIIQSIIDIS